jgi:hypothetical protein
MLEQGIVRLRNQSVTNVIQTLYIKFALAHYGVVDDGAYADGV